MLQKLIVNQKVELNLIGKSSIIKKIIFLKIGTLAAQNQVNKYPTLKLFRYGTPVKKEYRGARFVN